MKFLLPLLALYSTASMASYQCQKLGSTLSVEVGETVTATLQGSQVSVYSGAANGQSPYLLHGELGAAVLSISSVYKETHCRARVCPGEYLTVANFKTAETNETFYCDKI